MKSKWVIVAIALAVCLWIWWQQSSTPPAPDDLASASSPAQKPSAVPDEPLAAARESGRVALEPDPDPKVAPPAAAQVSTGFSGRCVDLSGVGIAGLEVEWIDKREARLDGDTLSYGNTGLILTPQQRVTLLDKRIAELTFPEFKDAIGITELLRGEKIRRPSAHTGVDGTFSFDQQGAKGDVALVRDDLMIATEFHVAKFPETWFVVVPCIELAGIVVDPEQRPIGAASLSWGFSLDGIRSFPHVVEDPVYISNSSRGGEDGRFDITRIPAVEDQTVSISAPGFVGARVTVPDRSQSNLIVVLQPQPVAGKNHIAGRVMHCDGRAAAGAFVNFGQDSATVEADGSFYIRLTTSGSPGTPLTAHMNGARPTALLEFGACLLAHDLAVDDALLVLDESLPPISGRVLDAAGKPCADWMVSLVGAQPLGSSNWTLEGTAAQDDSADKLTDAEGRFRFGGLLDHPYRVRGANLTTMIAIESDPVAPGTDDLVVRIPADAVIEKLAGRVVSRKGMPIDGALVKIGLVTASMGPGSYTSRFNDGVRADSQGRFELRDVPRNACKIGVEDSRVTWNSVDFDGSMAGRELLLEVDLDLRFRVETRIEGEFDRFCLYDGVGKRMTVLRHLPHMKSLNDAVHADKGKFPVCSTTEAAETMVLFLGDKEVRRLTVSLRIGEINVITP